LFTSSPSITTTKILIEDFGRPNIRDELDNGFERVTMHLVDIPSTTTELVNNGSIIVEERVGRGNLVFENFESQKDFLLV